MIIDLFPRSPALLSWLMDHRRKVRGEVDLDITESEVAAHVEEGDEEACRPWRRTMRETQQSFSNLRGDHRASSREVVKLWNFLTREKWGATVLRFNSGVAQWQSR